MARNPLLILSRVKESAVAQARRDLAQAAAAAQLQIDQLELQTRVIEVEQAAATAESLADFVAWLPLARSQAAQQRMVVTREQARVAVYRQALVSRRIEAEAVLKVLERHSANQALSRSRKDQAAMDEVAGRSKPAGP